MFKLDPIFMFMYVFIALMSTYEVLFTAKKNKTLLILLGIVMIFLTGFRSKNFGDDYMGYVMLYEWSKSFDIISFFTQPIVEPFYYLLNKIVDLFIGDYVYVFLISAIIAVYTKLKFIYTYSDYIFTSVLFYFAIYYLPMENIQMRQGIAIGIAALSVKYIINPNLWKFLGVVFIAAMFHKTAWVFIIAYPLRYVQLNATVQFFIALFFFFMSFSGLFTFVEDFLIDLGLFSNEIKGYVGTKWGVSLDIELGDFNKLLILFSFIFFEKELEKEYKAHKLFRNLFFVGTIFYFILHNNAIFASRIPIYFKFFEIILLTQLIGIAKENIQKRLFLFFIVFLYAFFLLIRLITNKGYFEFYENILF